MYVIVYKMSFHQQIFIGITYGNGGHFCSSICIMNSGPYTGGGGGSMGLVAPGDLDGSLMAIVC